ncbi:MAG: hypothetical protein IJW70_03945 [Clostridia bacterium]|nr:hypothetical protein [Clostridia bacterium]
MSLFFDVIFALIPLLALVIPIVAMIVLYSVYAPAIKSMQSTGNVRNYDALMQNYLFKTSLSKEELLDRLERLTATPKDKVTCDFFANTMRMVFHYREANVSFLVSVHEYEGARYVRLCKNELITSKSPLPYLINPFLIEKAGLEPVDYNTYINEI